MNIKLEALEARFLVAVQGGVLMEVDQGPRGADGVIFLCPKCYQEKGGPVGVHSVIAWMPHVPQSITPTGGRWDMWGTGIKDLSARPSIHLASGCGWHGFIGNGEASII